MGNACRALPVYLPVYLFPALLVHRKRLLDPKLAPDIARRAALGALRSSLFLSLYCTLAWRGACVGFQHTGKSSLLCMLCLAENTYKTRRHAKWFLNVGDIVWPFVCHMFGACPHNYTCAVPSWCNMLAPASCPRAGDA